MWAFLFWLSVGLVAYTYVGYPLFVGIAARLRLRPIKKSDFTPPLTLIVSAYNSQDVIRAKIENCLSLDYPGDKLTIVVVSDGSSDDTNDIVRAFEGQNIRLMDFKERRGKAACLNDAVASCDTEFIVFADARQRFNEQAIRSLMANLADDSVGAVGGELVIEDEGHTGFSQGVDFYWRYEKYIRHSEARFSSVVGVSGAIYAMRKALFKPIPQGTILDDVLIPMNVVLGGKRVGWEPEACAFDLPSRDPRWERRRKIRTLAGNYQLVAIERMLLDPSRNPIWLQFVSHKMLRLVAPFFLLLALLSNAVLAGGSSFYLWLLIPQLAFYAAAIIGVRTPSARDLTPVRIPTTFCMLNWFAVLGFVEFLSHKDTHLW